MTSTNLWKLSTIAFATLSAFLLVSRGDLASAEPSKDGKEAEAKKQEQPAMEGALKLLEQADELLAKGTHDKGGHRVKARGHVKAAIDEVKAGIAFDNKNTGKNENKR
jgi:hypothetical protein